MSIDLEKYKAYEAAIKIQIGRDPIGFYVYSHRFKSGKIYHGKGKGNRYCSIRKSGRSWRYEAALEQEGAPLVCIIQEGLSEDEAYRLEHELIALERASNESNLLNVTDGLENAPVEMLPWRTLSQVRQRYQSSDIAKSCVTLVNYKKGKVYFGVSAATAAIISKQSINSLVGSIARSDGMIDSEWKVIPRRKAIEYIKYLNKVIYLKRLDEADSAACTLAFYFSSINGLHHYSLYYFEKGGNRLAETYKFIATGPRCGTLFENYALCSKRKAMSINDQVAPEVFSALDRELQGAYQAEDLYDMVPRLDA